LRVDFPADPPSDDVPRQIINPKEELTIFVVLRGILTEKQNEGIQGENFRLYFWGGVDFTDAFGHKRWVRYRFEWGGEDARRLNLVSYAPQGNYTSEG
jgi:hypothetical protein